MAKDYTTLAPASTAEIYRTQLGDDVLSLHPADVLSLHPANNPVGLSIWDEKDPEAYAQVWIDRVRARELRDALSKWLDTTAVPEGTEPAAGVEIMPLLLATMEKTGGCPAEIAEDLSARVEIGRRKYGQPLRTNNGDATADKIRKAAIQLCLYLQKAHEEGHGSEAQLYAAIEALRSLYPGALVKDDEREMQEGFASVIMGGNRATHREPVPHGTGREIVPLLIHHLHVRGYCPPCVERDLLARRDYGIQEYGEPLRADNGRDVLTDTLQEALDLCVYLQQGVEEGRNWGTVLEVAIETLLALYSASSDELWASELLTASADITAEGAVAVLTQRPVAGISRTPPLTPEDLEAWEDDQRIQYASDGPVRLYRKLSGDKWLMEGSGVPRLLESRVMAAHFFNVATGRDSDAELGAYFDALLIDEPEDWAVELASFFLSMKTENTDEYMEAAAELLDRYCAATSPHQRVKIATHQTGGAYMVLREDMEPRKLADHSAINAEAARRFLESHPQQVPTADGCTCNPAFGIDDRCPKHGDQADDS